MKKILDNIEDLSVESSFNLLTDFLKRVGAGIIIGLVMAIIYSLVLTILDNIQEDLEDPFDGIGSDDIRLNFPTMLGPSTIED